jgi:uncharacterized HAD superfamily protein
MKEQKVSNNEKLSFIRTDIVNLLKDKNYLPKEKLYATLTKKNNHNTEDIEKVLDFMIDKGEIGYARDDKDLLRITNKGFETNSIWYKKIFYYIRKDWLAILALLVSAFNLIFK